LRPWGARTDSRLLPAGGRRERTKDETGNGPADNSPLFSGEMGRPFQAIQNNFDDIRARLLALTPLGLTVSHPPTQADVQALADKLDELINTLS